MKDDCLFCQIAHGDKEKLFWESDRAAAFRDLHPKAPVHLLVVPKQHVDSLDDTSDAAELGQLLLAVQAVAKQAGIAGGYRVQVNVGRAGGQVIDHLHVHVLGGQIFKD